MYLWVALSKKERLNPKMTAVSVLAVPKESSLVVYTRWIEVFLGCELLTLKLPGTKGYCSKSWGDGRKILVV